MADVAELESRLEQGVLLQKVPRRMHESTGNVDQDQIRLLESNSAGPVGRARYFKSPAVAHEARRVVEGRLMQAACGLFPGRSTGPFRRHFYIRAAARHGVFRQHRTDGHQHAGRLWPGVRLGPGACACQGQRYGCRDQRLPWVQRPPRRIDDRLSNAYADQVERDYDVFVKACRSGQREARTDADMAADFRV